MKIKKSSGDKEHSLRLLPCFGRRSRHPHQEKQLVNGLVHSFRKMLQQFIWDAIWTRSSSGTGVFNLGSRGSGGGSGPGFRNFMQGCCDQPALPTVVQCIFWCISVSTVIASLAGGFWSTVGVSALTAFPGWTVDYPGFGEA
ncbi:hypothetical protein WJX82_004915 [Trebouxia sp. C0006]